jgi:hypothetical protein
MIDTVCYHWLLPGFVTRLRLTIRESVSKVFFDYVSHDKWTTNLGYKKVEFCPKQGTLNHLRYLWIMLY